MVLRYQRPTVEVTSATLPAELERCLAETKILAGSCLLTGDPSKFKSPWMCRTPNGCR